MVRNPLYWEKHMANKEIAEKIAKLTLLQKARLLSGEELNTTHEIKSLGIRKMQFLDGPSGLRASREGGDSLSGISDSNPSTCFPCGATYAASFDSDLARRIGEQIGKECCYYKVDVLLGPAINIQRNPLCGRNFEYMSEDPYLTGALGLSFTNGVQSQNVGVSLKHYCCNGIEKFRFVGDSVVDERALYEIYLRAFHKVIKEAKPYTIMTAYNKVNGFHASEHEHLLNDITRKQFGFDGLFMTDWGGTKDRVASLKATQDMEMPGLVVDNINAVTDAVRAGTLKEEVLDQSVARLLELEEKTRHKKEVGKDIFEQGFELAVETAEKSAVLLKNDGVLPLKKEERPLYVGEFFKKMRYQGSGSSLLNPYRLVQPYEALDEEKLPYDCAQGYVADESDINERLESEALEMCKKADTIVFLGGLNDFTESEGSDKENLDFPKNQRHLLEKILELKKKVVLVLMTGTPLELPFVDGLNAILHLGLPGEGGGVALAHLLYGKVSPSGHLAETWFKAYADVPYGDEYGKSPIEAYKDSIFVGYRHGLDHANRVAYPFGYGLSYASFKVTSFKAKKGEGNLVFTLDVENTSKVPGIYTAQIYFGVPTSAFVRPIRSLVGIGRVYLKGGEKKKVEVVVNPDDLTVYDSRIGDYVYEKGNYRFEICEDSLHPLISVELELGERELTPDPVYQSFYGDKVKRAHLSDEDFSKVLGRPLPVYQKPTRPYDLETPLMYMEKGFGKVFLKAVTSYVLGPYRRALKMEEGPEKEREMKAGLFVAKMMPYNTLRSFAFSSSGVFKFHIARGILEMCNGHYLKGLKVMMEKDTYHEHE